MKCLSSSLCLSVLPAEQPASPEQVIREKESRVEIVSFYDPALEVTLHHFCCHLLHVTRSSPDQGRGMKTPPSLSSHSPISRWSLSLAAPEGKEGKGAGHAISLSENRAGERRVRINREGQTNQTGVLNVGIVQEQKNKHSQRSHGGAPYPPTVLFEICSHLGLARCNLFVQGCEHNCILSFVFIKRCGKGENGCADNSDKKCSL